jgi:hypothetical protein
MKKTSFGFTLIVAILFLSSSSAWAGEGHPPVKSNPVFDSIKSLQGTWKGKSNMKGEEQDVQVKYKVTSAGSAVEETLFPGTPHEMVSVYFLAGDDIMMTHYCAVGNQPRMKLTSSKGQKLVFEKVDVTGMKSENDMYMGALTLNIKGKNKLDAEWVSFENGQKKETTKLALTKEE